jgi:uncharacterized membrane protein YfhO
MGYILIVAIVIMIITLMAMWDMKYKIKELNSEKYRCEKEYMSLTSALRKENDDLKLQLQQPQVPTKEIEKPTNPLDLLYQELVQKTDQDELQSFIDFRKAWNWNGAKGVKNDK